MRRIGPKWTLSTKTFSMIEESTKTFRKTLSTKTFRKTLREFYDTYWKED
jgi:hypothetical protein